MPTPQNYSDLGYATQADMDRFYNPNTPKGPAPMAPAAPQATTAEPTVAQAYSMPEYDSAYDTALKEGGSYYRGQANQDIDENAIRQQTLSRFQKEIDATNGVYAQKLSQAKLQGQGRIGTTTAMNARNGTLGSDFGAAATEKTNQFNTEEQNSILDEQRAIVAGIQGKANKDAAEEIAAKRAAKLQGHEEYIKFLSESQSRKTARISKLAQSLVTQGVDISKLGPGELEKIASTYGITAEGIKSAFADSKKIYDEEQAKIALDKAKTESEIAKNNQFELGEGQAKYAIDPKTGKVTQVAFNPKTYAPKDTIPSSGVYTEKQLKALSKINQDVSKNATYAKTTNMRGYADNVVASLSQATGVGDLAAINQFQKVIDEGAVTRDQDVKLIQQSQSLLNSLKTKVKKLEKGEQLSTELRTQMQTAVESLYKAQTKALMKDPYIKAKTKEASLYGLTSDDTIISELSGFSDSQSNIVIAPDGQEIEIID